MSDMRSMQDMFNGTPEWEPQDQIESLRQQLAESEAEQLEQARLLGMGGEREARLMAQVAEKDAEIEHLKQSRENFATHAENTLQQLAASQAREVQLREALGLNVVRNPKYPWKPANNWDNCPACFEMFDLDKCEHCGAGYDDEYIHVKESTDITALEAMIQKAGEVMRERCESTLESIGAEDNCYGGAEEIRALPGVMMEDLKK